MNEEAGNFFTSNDYPNVLLMVLFHPAYLLRDPRKTDAMLAHLGHLRDRLAQEGWLEPSRQPSAIPADA